METTTTLADLLAASQSHWEKARHNARRRSAVRRAAARDEAEVNLTARQYASQTITNAADQKASFSLTDVLNEWGKPTRHYAAAVDDILQRAEKAGAVQLVGLTVIVTDEAMLCEVALHGLPR